ncbi:MAG: AAA family ATPase [Rhodocyclaceae bacterium]|nr:AAA family ATPase [Rhodocyclaceae bacterium]
MTDIPDYPVGTPIPLPACGTWPESVHVFDAKTVAALRAAEAAGRPLLMRGEPGTGKSQTARAAAAWAKRLFLSVVIDGRTEAQDLLWRYDAVARLSDAQLQAHGARDAYHYLSPGPLWWAYHWEGAHKQWEPRKQGEVPEAPPDWHEGQGTVLLMDEIDKADPDLPNAFLELLANRAFTVPYLGQKIVSGARAPLVVITTNEERELPNAFLRRCMVLTLSLPADLKPWLVRMATLHLERQEALKPRIFPKLLGKAADLLIAERTELEREQVYAPGLAEYLDLANALARLGKTEKQQETLLQEVAGFALRKSAPDKLR